MCEWETGRRKIKAESQAFGLNKRVDGATINRESGPYVEPQVWIMSPGTAATFDILDQ